jgi:hypothetical protein
MAAKKQGRRPKLTPELQAKICDAIRAGNYFEAAAEHSGIGKKHVLSLAVEGGRGDQRPLQTAARAGSERQRRCADGRLLSSGVRTSWAARSPACALHFGEHVRAARVRSMVDAQCLRCRGQCRICTERVGARRALADLSTAETLVGSDPGLRRRLDAVEGYAGFVRLISELDELLTNAKCTAADFDPLADALLRPFWNMYGTSFVNARQVHDWVTGFAATCQSTIATTWQLPAADYNTNIWGQNAASWRAAHRIHAYAPGALAPIIASAAAKHPRIVTSTVPLAIDNLAPVPVTPSAPWSGGCVPTLDPKGAPHCTDIEALPGDAGMVGTTSYAFAITSQSTGPILFEMETSYPVKGKARLVVSGPDCPSGPHCATHTYEVPLPPVGTWAQTVLWASAAPDGQTPLAQGTYTARVDNTGAYYRFRYPDSVPFAKIVKSSRPEASVVFFVVPPGVTELAFYTNSDYTNDQWVKSPGFRVLSTSGLDPTHPWGWNTTGTAVTATPSPDHSWLEQVGSSLWFVHVAPGDAGRVWRLGNGKGGYHLVNLPNLFARNPWQVMTPGAFLPLTP